ncbi:oxysterol-binding protein [Grosmannia clavigera kw1407]|uniref:Oxysterol-binding protein n=1 Tax=Grosmannia clavigera (strain kw1407 / UAMH 11150) TaxID=655863 RepID=F0XUZ4_GROCL|nr:oxysterol-binding protein [Grosmannia clavigera kw1407]EFW98826.1 oxysterol-binding protein [Grosmannia clavigera kw1407]
MDSTTSAQGSAGSSSANSSSWTAFLKSIASFNGDLSSLTAPPFILSAKSLTEFSSYWAEHPAIFAAPASEPDPEKRAVLVLKWFLTTLKQQYASRSEQYGNEKKPLNPFLGELFLGRWEDEESGTTELISEQVSHHPPATAYSITNLPTGVHLEGYNAQKASFSRSINIKQIGHAVLTVPVPTSATQTPASAAVNGNGTTDTYVITLPAIHVEGLFVGAPFLELEGSTYITSSTGYTARIDYSGRGWISGKKNSVTAVLYRTGNERDVLYHVSGQWTKAFDIFKGPAKSQDLFISYTPESKPTTPLIVEPIEAQHPLESRRAWARVAAGIAKGDLDAVGLEKGKIETAQREERTRENAEGRDWTRRYFTDAAAGRSTASDPALAALGSAAGLSANGDCDKTGGLWRFDSAKAAAVRQKGPLSEAEAAELAKRLLGQ